MPMIRKRKLHSIKTVYKGKSRRTVHVTEKWGSRQKLGTQSQELAEVQIENENPETNLIANCATSSSSVSDVDTLVTFDGNRRYDTEKAKRLEEWKSISPEIMSAYVQMQTPNKRQCADCCLSTDELYRCCDCCSWETTCLTCLRLRHKHPHLHLFEIWKNMAYLSFIDDDEAWKLNDHSCSTTYLKKLVVVDDKGRQHLKTLQFCKCEVEAVRLIRFNLWPSSTKFPKVAFHFDFMRWLCGLLLESSVSVKSFCSALDARTSKHMKTYIHHPVKDLYKVLVGGTAVEFRHFIYQTENIHHDGSKCPACYESSAKIYCCDADFQLVRKESSGKNWSDPKHNNRLFVDQDAVDLFIDEYSADKKKPEMNCSDFQAGNNLRSKYKNKKLSETAVFGCACRHECPKMFFSLKHGERLGYSVFLLNKLLEEDGQHGKLYLMYDIACSLHQHLKKNNQNAVLERTSFAIPIFHAYGHKVDCQILYSPRRIEGLGLTDGEGMERIWAFLGKFSKITKEMTPENRIDILTDALLHYGQKMKNKLGFSLPDKLARAEDIEKKSKEALQEILEPFAGVTTECLQEWIDYERVVCIRSKSTENHSLSHAEEYCLVLEELTKYRYF